MTQSQVTTEDLKQMFADYDTYFSLDESTSMDTEDAKIGSSTTSRWLAARETAEGYARLADKVDSDGISVVFFANKTTIYHNVNHQKLVEHYKNHKPLGGTDTAGMLKATFNHWNSNGRKNGKKLALICITDGEPASKEAVEREIVAFSKTLKDRNEARIQFVQIGDDEQTRIWLEHLDKGLNDAKYDIVNCQTLTHVNNVGLEEALKQVIADE